MNSEPNERDMTVGSVLNYAPYFRPIDFPELYRFLGDFVPCNRAEIFMARAPAFSPTLFSGARCRLWD
jgi:hypothetical protein